MIFSLYHIFRNVELAKEATESLIVAEARNVHLTSEPVYDDHCYDDDVDDDDDDEFSDTDSFDSTDEEEHAIISSRPDSNSSLKSEYIMQRNKNFIGKLIFCS